MIYLELFLTFFVIGAVAVGGGYAMLSLIQHQVVTVHGWISDSAFTDMIAISQMTPGPIGINSATYIGYSVLEASSASPFACFMGSFVATAAVVMPSFLIVLWLVKMYDRLKDNDVFKGTMAGLRPTVVGLIGAAALVLMFKVSMDGGYELSIQEENFPDWKSWVIFGAAFVSTWKFKANPILIILVAAVVGVVLY